MIAEQNISKKVFLKIAVKVAKLSLWSEIFEKYLWRSLFLAKF